jgi:hypothetical protein
MDEIPLPTKDPTAGLREADRARLKAELRPGEKVVWASGSVHDPRNPDGGCLVPTAIAAALSALVGAIGMASGLDPENRSGSDKALVLGVGGIVFCFLLSLGLIYSGYAAWGNWGKRRRRLYALTDARAIFWEPGDGRSVVVFHLEHRQIQRVWRVEHPDGAGDVVLRATVPGPQHDRQQTFFGVPETRRAEDLARTLSEQARTRWRRRTNRSPLPDDDLGAPAPSQDPRP